MKRNLFILFMAAVAAFLICLGTREMYLVLTGVIWLLNELL